MELKVPTTVIRSFSWDEASKFVPLGQGHINKTFLVISQGDKYVLQKINTTVFKDPEGLMSNLVQILDHLSQSEFPYAIYQVIHTRDGNIFHNDETGFWRAFRFLEGNESPGRITAGIASLAAEAYAVFAHYLLDLDHGKLNPVIPNFHNPEFRFHQFLEVIEINSGDRKENARELIEHALAFGGIPQQYELSIKNLPVRVIHGDTKLSNLIFDSSFSKVRGMVDLDTTGPGYLINDIGDMVRSMANTSNEDEADPSKVFIDFQIFRQLLKSYLRQLKNVITEFEIVQIVIGIKAIIYEQFLRFLTDYLKWDVYYQVDYPDQNYNRARNHLHLLMDFNSKESQAEDMVGEISEGL